MTYKGISGLDTFEAFDEKGFQYWHHVREGATFSANSCSEVIYNIFNAMSKKSEFQKVRRYVVADAAFCNTEFFNACISKHAGFITPLKRDMLDTVLWQVREWLPQNPGKKNRITFHDGRECQVGETLYTLENCAQVLRVVVIRAERPDCGRSLKTEYVLAN